MSSDHPQERVRVFALRELDALIGARIMGESADKHWEDADSEFQFATFEDALDAQYDPFFQQFIPADEEKARVLREVKEFRRFSSELALAWEVVERVSEMLDAPLYIRRDNGHWLASFGSLQPIVAKTPPLAMCLAALRTIGVEVEILGDKLRRELAQRSARAAQR